MKKSIAAVCAVFVICIAVFAGAAAGGYGEYVGDLYYYHCDNADDLQGSVDQSLPNKITVLDSSITLKKQIDVKKDARIDLNGNTISCDRNCRAFFVHEDGYLEISNGALSGGYAKYDAGGAIFVRNADLNMKNVKISDCQAQEGGGIAAINSNCLVVDSEISNCKVDDKKCWPNYCGGGIFVKNSDVTVKNCCVKDCWADDWGGGVHVDSGTFYMYGSKLLDCKVDDEQGGGIYVNEGAKFYVGQGSEIKNCCSKIAIIISHWTLDGIYYSDRHESKYDREEVGPDETVTNM